MLVDLMVAGVISTTPGSFHGLPGGPKNSFSCELAKKPLPEMSIDAPGKPDFLLRLTEGGTTVNVFAIVSAGTHSLVKLETLQTRTVYVPGGTFGTSNVVAQVDEPKKFGVEPSDVALPDGSQINQIASSPLPGTHRLPETLIV